MLMFEEWVFLFLLTLVLGGLCAAKDSPNPQRRFKGGRGRTYCVSPPLRPPLKIPPETPPRRIIPLHDVRKIARGSQYAHPLGFSAWTPASATILSITLFI
ncbi:MAG: hypothetical protein ACK5T0_00755 [Vampirovibrionales bacterium]